MGLNGTLRPWSNARLEEKITPTVFLLPSLIKTVWEIHFTWSKGRKGASFEAGTALWAASFSAPCAGGNDAEREPLLAAFFARDGCDAHAQRIELNETASVGLIVCAAVFVKRGDVHVKQRVRC